jgi:hypothetical protein
MERAGQLQPVDVRGVSCPVVDQKRKGGGVGFGRRFWHEQRRWNVRILPLDVARFGFSERLGIQIVQRYQVPWTDDNASGRTASRVRENERTKASSCSTAAVQRPSPRVACERALARLIEGEARRGPRVSPLSRSA